jgi:hypothetical protein
VNNALAYLSLCGPVSIGIALVVLALLSQRLGAVTKRPPLYRWYFLSVAIIGVAIILRIVNLSAPDIDYDNMTTLLYDVALVIGLSLAVIIAWRYWGWLLSERGKDTRSQP